MAADFRALQASAKSVTILPGSGMTVDVDRDLRCTGIGICRIRKRYQPELLYVVELENLARFSEENG
jgi:hypothetical protein